MNIFMKKPKIFLLCILPFFVSLGSIDSILNFTSSNSFQILSNSNTTKSIVLLLFTLFGTILLFAIYLYIGIVFFRKRNYILYKIFAFINFFWFGINAIGIFVITFSNISIASNSTSFFSNTIFYLVILVFQVVDIYLLVTYNQYQKKILTIN